MEVLRLPVPTKVILKDAQTRQILKVPYTVHYVFEDEVFPPENVPKERSVVVEMSRKTVDKQIGNGKKERAVVEKCCSYSTVCQVTECVVEEDESEMMTRDDAGTRQKERKAPEVVMTMLCVTAKRPTTTPEQSSTLKPLDNLISEFQQRNEVIRELLNGPIGRS